MSVTRKRWPMWCAAIGAAAAWLCPAAGRAGELLVASAVSLREPLEELVQAYQRSWPEARVQLSYGASSTLAAQIAAGAPVDVFLAADEHSVDALQEKGFVAADSRFALARNRLVVIQPADARVRIERAEDLARDDVRRIAVPEYAVPIGRYARQWLEARGLLERLRPRMLQTEHARASLAAVDYGHADAAIVYATDARVARSARVAFEVPDAEMPHIAYTAVRVAESRHPEEAERFLAFLRGPEALAALGASGFAAPR